MEPSLLPPQKIQAIINAVSKLPYDVLWKWNQDELPGRTRNIKISKWLPQSDLLRKCFLHVNTIQIDLAAKKLKQYNVRA